MKSKKKETEREARKFHERWLPKVVERLFVILSNIRNHAELKEDDWDVLKTAYRWYDSGDLSQFEPEVSPLQQENMTKTTQPDLFAVNSDKAGQDVTVHPPCIEFGIGVDELGAETIKEKKK